MNRRITFVSRGAARREWETTEVATSRVMCVEPLKVLKFALGNNERLDVERVILDRSATAFDFLELLADLSPEVTADVLMIREDGSAFLSALARAGSRVLYALGVADVEFYLMTHGLVAYDRALEKLSA